MSTTQLFIPDRINVGFQHRKDTYTGKLAYVIYYDQKGVLRKETSWQSWRDEKIDPIAYTNEPTEGFVLNKKVGGTHGHSWEQRNTYVRIYDPRGFEFEISIPNLLFILAEGDCSRGKGLEGQFVYAWDGSDLVLLPATSQDYRSSREHTDLLAQKVKAKELILGATYLTKDLKTLTYLGRFDRYMPISSTWHVKPKDAGLTRPYVFWDGKDFVFHTSMAKLGKLVCDTPVGNYAELVDAYGKSQYGSKIVKLFLADDGGATHRCWFTERDGVFLQCATNYHPWNDVTSMLVSIESNDTLALRDGLLHIAYNRRKAWSPKYQRDRQDQRYMSSYYTNTTDFPWIPPTTYSLHALLESGTEYSVSACGLIPIIMKENTDGID